jgi:sn1-specific diacylglycerol lipase
MDWVSIISYATRAAKHILQFIATRKTLEANMQNVNMFPPGRVFWAVRENDLHPSHNNSLRHYRNDGATIGPSTSDRKPNKLRLFEVSDVEKVFSQIVFAKDMLTSVHGFSLHAIANYLYSAHMPHQYDRVLHDLL